MNMFRSWEFFRIFAFPVAMSPYFISNSTYWIEYPILQIVFNIISCHLQVALSSSILLQTMQHLYASLGSPFLIIIIEMTSIMAFGVNGMGQTKNFLHLKCLFICIKLRGIAFLLVTMTFSLKMRQQHSPRVPQLIIALKLTLNCHTVALSTQKRDRITINVCCMSNSIYLYNFIYITA